MEVLRFIANHASVEVHCQPCKCWGSVPNMQLKSLSIAVKVDRGNDNILGPMLQKADYVEANTNWPCHTCYSAGNMPTCHATSSNVFGRRKRAFRLAYKNCTHYKDVRQTYKYNLMATYLMHCPLPMFGLSDFQIFLEWHLHQLESFQKCLSGSWTIQKCLSGCWTIRGRRLTPV